jgi:hypothetical protein
MGAREKRGRLGPRVRACGTGAGVGGRPPRRCKTVVESILHTVCTSPACGGRCARVRRPGAGGASCGRKVGKCGENSPIARARPGSHTCPYAFLHPTPISPAMRQCRAEVWAPTMALGASGGACRKSGGCRNGGVFCRRHIRFCGACAALCPAPVPAPVLVSAAVRKSEHAAWRWFCVIARAAAQGAGRNSNSTTLFQKSSHGTFLAGNSADVLLTHLT